MMIEALVARYGLAALFAGAALEGEAAVVTGGLLAHQGFFPLPAAMAAAATGSFFADQAWFAMGRRFRDHPRIRRLRERPTFTRALATLERHPRGFILAFRFVYGLRTVSPIAIGTSRVPARLFIPLNAAAAIIWAVAFSAIGYLFGDAFEQAIGGLRRDGRLWWIAGGLVVIGLLVILVRRYRERRR